MKHERYSVVRPLHLLALAAAMLLGSARADEYSDVTQLVRSGKLAEAMTKAEQYLTTKPKDPQMRFLKGVIQRDSGKAPEAIGTFTRLTEDYPELPEPYNNLAVLYTNHDQTLAPGNRAPRTARNGHSEVTAAAYQTPSTQ